MNLVVGTYIEAVKHLNLPSKQLITPAPSSKNILAEVVQNFTNLHGLLHPIVPVSSTMNNQDLEMVNMLKI